MKFALSRQAQGQLKEASDLFRNILRQNPRYWPALNALGIIAAKQGRHAPAQSYFRRAITLAPAAPEPRCNLARSLEDVGQPRDALEQLKAAERAVPESAEIQARLGGLYARFRMADPAIHHHGRAVELDPSSSKRFFSHVAAKRQVCDWSRYQEDDADLRRLARQGVRINPFALLSADSTPAEQLACAISWSRNFEQPETSWVRRSPRLGGKTLRVGYISGDFHAHATSYLIVELLEKHDRDSVEVFGFSYGRHDDSPIRHRLVAAFDHFVPLNGLSDVEAAQCIADHGIDVLVDLKGYTEGARSEILGFRPAPIQVNYLGFPGTMGASFIDYVIADPHVAPISLQQFSLEKLVHLPGCFQPNDTQRTSMARSPSRAEVGLPEQAFVFCSFNNAYKIGPRTLDVWTRILKATPNSVLWLLARSGTARINLRQAAAERGLDPRRLIFAPHVPQVEHLARIALADLCLDTLPVGAFTTASDALWTGTPLLTQAGQTPAGRGAMSLLMAMGAPELVTETLEDYAATAIRLAAAPDALLELRNRIAANRTCSALFDPTRQARALEQAYREMVRRQDMGEAPAPFSVDISAEASLT